MGKMRVTIFWFRRDLRVEDNAGLYHALRGAGPNGPAKNREGSRAMGEAPVLPLFIFDRTILDRLESKADRRVEFIQAAVEHLQVKLVEWGSSLEVRDGKPVEVFRDLLMEYEVAAVVANTDYEPDAVERDKAVGQLLAEGGVAFHTYKDQVIFEKDEVVKEDGSPYTVYTPYSRRWRAKVNEFYLSEYPTGKWRGRFVRRGPRAVPSLEALGFVRTGGPFPRDVIAPGVFEHYKDRRDLPAVAGTSRLGVHLRFGTVSVRELARRAVRESDVFLGELIWRDFFQTIIWHFPAMGRGRAFKPAYEHIRWRNDEREFEKWCAGETGFPLVDAGMRELNATGFMHNRVRMVAASFLAKHLLIDWRWGEAYFAEKLLDFDLAANNGNWQWAAGCGCDAAPYFRIFNPMAQAKRWDPRGEYIRRWVPELDEMRYPPPMVDHELARKRALEVYRRAVAGVNG